MRHSEWIIVAVGAAVAAAGSAAFVKIALVPVRAERSEIQTQLARKQQRIEQVGLFKEAAPADPAAVITELRRRLDAIDAINAGSLRSEDVYRSVEQMAVRVGIELERVEPRGTRATSSLAPGNAGDAIRKTDYVVEASGSFEQVYRFVLALEREMGATRLGSLRLWPARLESPGADTVHALIEVTHFHFDLTRKTGSGDRGAPGDAGGDT